MRRILLLVVSSTFFLAACTAAPPTIDAARDDGSVDGGGLVDAGLTDADSPDGATPDSGPPPLDASLADTGAPDAGPCGDFGQSCCPGGACSQGACLAGRCATFGGLYARQGEASDECVGNPLSGGACACPAGFVTERLGDLDGDSDEGTGWETRIYHCVAAVDVPGADYRGAYGAILGAPPADCAFNCTVANAHTSDCTCPGGTAEVVGGVHFLSASVGPDCRREVGLCRDPAVEPLTYGGFYWEMTDSGTTCQESEPADRCRPNLLTGTCSCPEGFLWNRIDLMQIHPDAVRADANWHCRGALTVCQRLPS